MERRTINSGLPVVEIAKEHFMRQFQRENDPLYRLMDRHVLEVEKNALEIMKDYPEVDTEVVELSVWIHDIGRISRRKDMDHAVYAEIEARRFLPRFGVKPEVVDAVAHSVRAHRNKDIAPATLEAKILAAADSLSHMTDVNYIIHVRDGLRKYAEEKIERDYRDIGLLPGLKEKYTSLYLAWKNLLEVMPNPPTSVSDPYNK